MTADRAERWPRCPNVPDCLCRDAVLAGVEPACPACRVLLGTYRDMNGWAPSPDGFYTCGRLPRDRRRAVKEAVRRARRRLNPTARPR